MCFMVLKLCHKTVSKDKGKKVTCLENNNLFSIQVTYNLLMFPSLRSDAVAPLHPHHQEEVERL